MKGKILFVSGYFGAGKSTMLHAAKAEINELKHLPTYSTRPPRPEEVTKDSYEYMFVTKAEYDALRHASKKWDHTKNAGNYYGNDVEAIEKLRDAGEHFIIGQTVNINKIEEMMDWYDEPKELIWIDTALEEANRRLVERDNDKNHYRLQDPDQTLEAGQAVKEAADYVFSPKGELEPDKKAFVQLCRGILEK